MKVHLLRAGTSSTYCGTKAQADYELKTTGDVDKFLRISQNPEATFPACERCQAKFVSIMTTATGGCQVSESPLPSV